MTATITLPVDEDALLAFEGQVIPSEVSNSVRYKIGRQLGEGGLSSAFVALRVAADGESVVVLKLFKPQLVKEAGEAAITAARKEAVALGRLNEHVPPTAFVVRLIDAGSVQVLFGKVPLVLPWLAIEYVHGGLLGTTLEERVQYNIEHTRHAFDPVRAAHAVENIAKGLTVVHSVGVIHRDLTPANVLCCGFGEEEIFKIADFGIARPAGVAATFGGIVVGTPGYAPPEQISLDASGISPKSDVFSFAAVIYYLLTGEHYFPTYSPIEGLRAVRTDARRSITEAPALDPDLRQQSAACQAIDLALARATGARSEVRPENAEALGILVSRWLRLESKRGHEPRSTVDQIAGEAATEFGGWSWNVRHAPGDQRVVRSVAWDGDARCLAATDQGLQFWNGIEWQRAPEHGLPDARGLRFVQRLGAGRWYVGGDGALLAIYSEDGVEEVIRGPDPSLSFSHASGDSDDLAIIVGVQPEKSPVLYARSARRWLRPLRLKEAAFVSSVARIAEEEWLVCGRSLDQRGFAAVYRPLYFEATRLEIPDVTSVLACAGHLQREMGLAACTGGVVLSVRQRQVGPGRLPNEVDLSAASLDPAGRAWTASAGCIWLLQRGSTPTWTRAWENATWSAPFVSLFADVGMVVGMSADGAVVEGHTRR